MPRYRSDDDNEYLRTSDEEEEAEHVPYDQVWCELCQHAPCQCADAVPPQQLALHIMRNFLHHRK